VFKDGTMGPIHFIRYSPGFNEQNTDYPFYKQSKDKGFVEACDELLADPLMVQQWAEENRGDAILPLNRPLQAFCYYPLADGRLVAMWKNWLTSFSSDGGKTWGEVYAAPGFFTGTAKEWGQRLSDGTFAVVYNPSKFRWPMAICLSRDGLTYDNMYNVHGDISPMRYTGNEKSYGPQYLRGIMPGNGVVPDNNMWLTYSVNKEDIWTMRVTVPVQTAAAAPINEDLSKYTKVGELTRWNVYSPVWAPVTVDKAPNGQNALHLADQDPYDYAKVEHLFPDSKKFAVEFSVIPAQNDKGLLHIELQNEVGLPAIRILFTENGVIQAKRGAKFADLAKYAPNEKYDIRIEADATTMTYRVSVNGGRPSNQAFYAPMQSFSRVVFRTGETNKIPTTDNSAYEDYVLDKGGVPVPRADFYIVSLKTTH
jgi:hypothetical protein